MLFFFAGTLDSIHFRSLVISSRTGWLCPKQQFVPKSRDNFFFWSKETYQGEK